MSWTSEHDPPPSRPSDETGAADESDVDLSDLPDDGPLDPSVFDGLFDDLADDPVDHEVSDNPLDEFLSVTLTDDADEQVDDDEQVADPDGGEVAVDEQVDDDVEVVAPDDIAADDIAVDEIAADDIAVDEIAADDDVAVEAAEDLEPDGQVDPAVVPEPGPELDDDDTLIVGLTDGAGPGTTELLADEGEVREADGSFATNDEPAIEPAGEAGGQPVPPAMPIRTDDDADDGIEIIDGDIETDDRFDGEPDPQGWFDDADATERHKGPPLGPGASDPAPVEEPALFPATDPVADHQDHDDDHDGTYDDDHDDRFVDLLDHGPTERVTAFEPAPVAEPSPFVGAAATEDGPVMASPPIQHDPHPEQEFVPAPSFEEEHLTPTPADDRPKRARRLLVALVAAVVFGGGLGVGGAMLLTRLVDRGETAPATATGADDGTETAAATAEADPGPPGGPSTSLQIASLRFQPGPGTMTLAPSASLDLLAAAIQRDPAMPIAATVRTFTEPTAAEDLILSVAQADALTAKLIELGADPERVAVSGLGRSLLTSAQPVPNFVVPSAGLESSTLADVTRRIGPFAIGLDPATGQLRAESVAALDALARAAASDTNGRSLTLAGYSFDQRDAAGNERQAELAVAAATAHLTEAGLDPARIATIVAGDEPFAVPDRVSNHIDLHWGDRATGPLSVSRLAIEQIDFATGSSDLGPQAGSTIDRLGALLLELGGEVVIDVHSFDGDEVQDRVDRSVLRAQAIGQRLLAAGVPAQQLRLHGGTSAQFRAEDRVSRLVITWLQPPDQS